VSLYLTYIPKRRLIGYDPHMDSLFATGGARMKSVIDRLPPEIRSNPDYIKKTILPSWWRDDAADDDSGLAHGVMIIADRLGIDPKSLWPYDPASVSYLDKTSGKFWKHSDANDSVLQPAAHLAECAAKIVIGITPTAKKKFADTADEIYSILLKKSPIGVGFESLVKYCWDCGVPVIHLSKFPNEIKKMVGVAFSIDGKPAIVLTSERKSRAWHLFPLAHELAHIVLRHLDRNGGIVDTLQQIGFTDESDPVIGISEYEKQANEFAHRLLTGADEFVVHPEYDGPNGPKGSTLANYSAELARNHGIDRGYVILRYGRETGRWGVTQNALNKLGHEDAVSILNTQMSRRLRWADLDYDSTEYLERITGISSGV
jgi:hypothetical protein